MNNNTLNFVSFCLFSNGDKGSHVRSCLGLYIC